MVAYIFKVRNSILYPYVSITGIYKRIQLWVMRSHTRAQLKKLSSEQLADVGLTREDVVIETKKAFWED